MVEFELKEDPQKPGSPSAAEIDARSSHFHWRISGMPHVWRPPTDVYLTADAIVVRVEIAGMQDAQFSIGLDGRHLSIRGTRTEAPERRAYHQMEIRRGDFLTEIELHWPVDAQAVSAEYQDGFLRVVLPKAIAHRIEIGEE